MTLAEHVRTPSWVLTDLRPGTVYLFLVRSANAHGLSDPSPISDAVRTHGQWAPDVSLSMDIGFYTL